MPSQFETSSRKGISLTRWNRVERIRVSNSIGRWSKRCWSGSVMFTYQFSRRLRGRCQNAPPQAHRSLQTNPQSPVGLAASSVMAAHTALYSSGSPEFLAYGSGAFILNCGGLCHCSSLPLRTTLRSSGSSLAITNLSLFAATTTFVFRRNCL